LQATSPGCQPGVTNIARPACRQLRVPTSSGQPHPDDH
jgi:hypothetical protein